MTFEMHAEAIDKNTLWALKKIEQKNLLKDFYLAGGTAVALHLGHRVSNDLNFFSGTDFDSAELNKMLSEICDFNKKLANRNNLVGSSYGTRISFLFDITPLIRPLEEWDGVGVAALDDLIALKVEAICDRCSKRDFIDLFCMMQKLDLTENDIINLHHEKYADKGSDADVLKSLRLFANADKEEMPDMRINLEWDDVKKFFKKQKIKMEMRET